MCGVIGFFGNPILSDCLRSLSFLTHRGQDASGLAWMNQSNECHVIKDKVFPLKLSIPNDESVIGVIGSTRYPTNGIRISDRVDTEKFAQPYQYQINNGFTALVHNGQLTNVFQLSEGFDFTSDADLICKLLNEKIIKTDHDYIKSVNSLMNELDGAYSEVVLIKHETKNIMLVFRDPYGIRPLIMGKYNETYVFASESVAIEQLGGQIIRDVTPGELIILSSDENFPSQPIIEFHQIKRLPQSQHCMFEYVYFASPASKIDNQSVYDVRLKLGVALAKEISKRNIKVDYVVPVPDSSRISAQSIAETLNVPLREAILKNRYFTKRTFILNNKIQRDQALDTKYIYIKEFIENHTILVVDDSIVRGNTSKKIIKRLRSFGPKMIIFASNCPPIIRPCYYGIDMSIDTELIARNLSLTEIKESIGADLVIYQGMGDLYESINLEGLCTACISGDYPTENGRKIRKLVQEGKLDPDIPHYEQHLPVN